jgi:hypothetical protein
MLLTLDPRHRADDVCGLTSTINNSTSMDHSSSEETENTSFGGGAQRFPLHQSSLADVNKSILHYEF